MSSAELLKIMGAIAGIGLAAGTLISFASAADDTTEQRLLNAAQEQDNWIHHHHDYTAQRYSPLNQINRNNVKGLHVAWTMALGGVEGGGIWSHGGLEGTPIVENGFMYVTDGWGSVYKIDLHGGTGKLVWRMDPKLFCRSQPPPVAHPLPRKTPPSAAKLR